MSMVVPHGPLAQLAAAQVPAMLEDIPGGATGLLPVTALDTPLLVIVPAWPVSNPQPGRPEKLVLQWDGLEVQCREWEAKIPPEELEFRLPSGALSEGSHRLSYRVIPPNGEIGDSLELILTVDRTPPALGREEGALVIDPQVIAEGVTYGYLEENGDGLEVEVPVYSEPVPGDRILWYWDRRLNEYELVDERTLYLEDLQAPVKLQYTGDMIRERGDGARFVHYEIHDRAGNKSARSRQVQLEVSATPPRRVLQWPEVSDTRGSGEEVTFDLNRFAGDLFVTVSDDAVIEPEETVQVQWAQPGAVGSFTTAPGQPGRFPIPDDKIAAHSAKVIPVYYEVIDTKGEKHASAQRRVNVSRLTTGFPAPQIRGATPSAVYLSQLGETVIITLANWFLISTDQRVTLTVEGVSESSSDAVRYAVLTDHAVTPLEMEKGLGSNDEVTVPKSFLQTLQRGQQFRVLALVSFDGGETWPAGPNFPPLSLTLYD